MTKRKLIILLSVMGPLKTKRQKMYGKIPKENPKPRKLVDCLGTKVILFFI